MCCLRPVRGCRLTLLSRLEFGSFLSYTPRPTPGDQEQEGSKNLTTNLKRDRAVGNPPAPVSQLLATAMKEHLASLPFRQFFGPTTALVPVPSSSLRSKGALWVPLNLAEALEALGLGQAMPILSRRVALPKSATAEAKHRSTAVAHYESLDVDARLDVPEEILLVDDVITRGATLLGAASRLHHSFPAARIRAFAMVRTVSNAEEFVSLKDSHTGCIELRSNGQTSRRP